MRAGQWLTNRGIAAARTSWERAKQVADRLPPGEPDLLSLRIAPRTLLCASAYRGGGRVDDTGFDELRGLCEQAGDKKVARNRDGRPAGIDESAQSNS